MALPEGVRIEGDAIIISLPNDPIDGAKREAEVDFIHWNKKPKQIILGMEVFFLDTENSRVENSTRRPTYQVSLIANRDLWVNQMGKVVPGTIENPEYDPEDEGSQQTVDNPEAVMKEYDFYIYVFKNQPIAFFEMIAQVCFDAILTGKYDI